MVDRQSLECFLSAGNWTSLRTVITVMPSAGSESVIEDSLPAYAAGQPGA